ncbi:MAG: hypothetical protein WCP10_13720 [Desulfuromonadales bacterium]
MDEAITFWLDNKVSTGIKVTEIGLQMLVVYRDKFYVVENGAALMKGGRALYYSKTSLPGLWKKAQRGILPPPAADETVSPDDYLPVAISKRRERTKMPSTSEAVQQDNSPNIKTPQAPRQSAASKKSGVKPVATTQTGVTAGCPYCNCKHELSIEKGKNGKAFLVTCLKCSGEFGVRFVPTTVFQAQVAAFK